MRGAIRAASARALVVGIAVFCVVVAVALIADRLIPETAAQTDRILESRLNVMEQRFYGLESRLNRIEQASIRPSVTVPAAQDQTAEIQFLRSQVDSLRTRVGELECAVLKLDERTLTAAARARRQGHAVGAPDRCRMDNSTPVQLSARP